MDNTNRCLIVTCGFFGDILFASSIAEKLKSQLAYDTVDYLIGFPQVQRLLQNNPHIDSVYISGTPGPYPDISSIATEHYSKVFNLQPLNYNKTPCEEYQEFVGIPNTSPDYKVYTQPEYDDIARGYIAELRETHNKPVVALMSNWESKTYTFTPEQYSEGIDVPGYGYGGSHRNISYIIEKLSEYITFVEVGVGPMGQLQSISIGDGDSKSLLFEASLIKYCDAFLGTEGGLCNLSAGVGCKTVITGDFVHQLYGWNGCIKQIDVPKLGPRWYFLDSNHIELDPYLTDDEIINNVLENIL